MSSGFNQPHFPNFEGELENGSLKIKLNNGKKIKMNNIDISLQAVNGNGTIIYTKNGIKFTYTGNIVNGKMDGSGLLESKLFTITGIFKNDVPIKGTKILPDGSIYMGELNENGNRHGDGIIKTSFGTKYSGKWVNNLLQGEGFVDNEKSKRSGFFVDNRLNGEITEVMKGNNKTLKYYVVDGSPDYEKPVSILWLDNIFTGTTTRDNKFFVGNNKYNNGNTNLKMSGKIDKHSLEFIPDPININSPSSQSSRKRLRDVNIDDNLNDNINNNSKSQKIN